jgi:hypothetical protein
VGCVWFDLPHHERNGADDDRQTTIAARDALSKLAATPPPNQVDWMSISGPPRSAFVAGTVPFRDVPPAIPPLDVAHCVRRGGVGDAHASAQKLSSVRAPASRAGSNGGNCDAFGGNATD